MSSDSVTPRLVDDIGSNKHHKTHLHSDTDSWGKLGRYEAPLKGKF